MRYENKKLALAAVAMFLAGCALDAFACTGFYVGRKVSADGTTLIGRTNDAAPWNGLVRMGRFERGARSYADGTVNDYAFVCVCDVTSLNEGFYGGGTINEKGVMLTATVTGRTKDVAKSADPFVSVEDGGYGEPNLPDYMIGKSATAREAVEILGRMIAEHGHSGSEIYMVADSNEAWYVEVYTGHEWAAVKMPEDKVAVFGNQFNIRDFNTNDTENVMCSTNLVGLAAQREFLVWKDQQKGIVDLYATYSPELWDYANYRTYWGHNAWAPTAFPSNSYETATAYPLFFDPEPGKKIALTEIFELMRTRYEGVNCPDENTNTSIRVIGTTKQMSSHVLQMRHDLPTEYRCTLWGCHAQSEHSTYLPVCMAVRGFSESYTRDQEGTYGYDSRRAADAFLRLDTLAELKRFVVDTYGKRQDVRSCYGAGVRAHWREQESRLVEDWPQMLAEWMKIGKHAGCARATAYVTFQQVWSLAEAKRLHDELAWYWAEFNCDLRDGGGATDVPTRPFASSMPTNAELGVLWTRWHRTEFDAYVEELAGPQETRSADVATLVAASKTVFDNVADAASLAEAKAEMEQIVLALCQGPLGSPGNPWRGGDSVFVWTNGTGRLVIEGTGAMSDYACAADVPWRAAFADVRAVSVAATVKLGVNSLVGMSAAVPVNGLVPADLFAAVGGATPVGAISPAEFERIEIVDGFARLGVSVSTNGTLTGEGWGVAAEDVIAVPAPSRSGFMILKSKGAAK